MPIELTLHWQGRPTRCGRAAILDRLTPLTPRYELAPGGRHTRTATYLDTVDWRLRRRGLVLRHVAGSLVLDGEGGPWRTELPKEPSWPVLADGLAPGEVRDEVSRAMWVRAIAPKLRARTLSREVTVRDAEGRTVAEVVWAESAGVEPVETEPLTHVTVRSPRKRDGERVAQILLTGAEFLPGEARVYDELLTASGLPEERLKPEIAADTPADAAIARALLGFADTIDANVEGTIDDIDTEFLHELRVAVRRTRSLLKIAGDVLPEPAPKGFKWVGALTTPTRDLDVYLLSLPGFARDITVGGPADLEPFQAHLVWERARERRKLVAGLRSKKFRKLLDRWRASLREVAEAGESPVTAAELATDRLHHVAADVLAQAAAITPDSPAEHVHTLRKRCKELRYALEVFRPLCEPEPYKKVLKNLKRLQDVLGAFQDGEVQSEHLRLYAERMLHREDPPAATLLAMGELLSRFIRQQHEARHALGEALEKFLGDKTRDQLDALLPAASCIS
ncbi:CHAD domain-containing protein [Amycolatopsis acidicola]|uniref:CHAD domain-containing protein n=1 Tax=Amycolatopsis acidicola TaxID=2596893 RepID=A0A5N0VJ27_9PSEU|nr:CHAD domain-containing protein [Amycolatopsis acidicola]KAA9166377.1 CHAD domain-containing protein [Amycolatopsis acidicola]